jgi:hypothetical protein
MNGLSSCAACSDEFRTRQRQPPAQIRCKRTGPADLMNDRSDASCRPIRRSSSLDGAPAHTSHRMRKVHREWTRPSGA